MAEVETKITELRDAADQMNRSCLRIDQCMADVRDIVQSLLAAGWQSEQAATFVLRYSAFQGELDSWSATMQKLALDLNRAANDIESAVQPTASAAPVVVSHGYGGRGRWRSGRRTPPEAPPPPLPYSVDDFVSPVNRPLYDQLTSDRQKLASEQMKLDILLQTRAHVADDLGALKTRLLSYDPKMNVNSVPRVQAMQSQLDSYDQQIAQSQQHITDLRTEITDLSARLERVKPAPGADLRLITDMEHAQTTAWVKASTQGCVNYIANRMPIPDGIAQNAYLWDDKARELTQYGITVGDKPLVGSVIVLEREHSYADHVFGHVMYVEKVDQGVVWITDNTHPKPVLLTDLTTEVSGPNVHYLYFPWWTQG
jgi:surface antigen